MGYKGLCWPAALCRRIERHNLAQTFQNAMFTYAHQKCNHAAHVVASYVSKDGGVYLWDYIGPDFIFDILAEDVNISIRI
ncbi:hypothetical protein DVH24_039084 [Malus domestica]|uniref:Uncharacterized protein n=1 Tax=Malus domestica TaxID=3750 RepID=A0A498K943_MALDO|nr:hypothetical protein DVH24_039084 [Malus domestica]